MSDFLEALQRAHAQGLVSNEEFSKQLGLNISALADELDYNKPIITPDFMDLFQEWQKNER